VGALNVTPPGKTNLQARYLSRTGAQCVPALPNPRLLTLVPAGTARSPSRLLKICLVFHSVGACRKFLRCGVVVCVDKYSQGGDNSQESPFRQRAESETSSVGALSECEFFGQMRIWALMPPSFPLVNGGRRGIPRQLAD
jgi:hypothetical protein